MKPSMLFACILVFNLNVFAQVKNVAMLEPVAVTDDVSVIVKRMIRGELTKSISKEDGFNAFTREDIDKMLKEHNFQESGMVNDEQRLKLGEMTGADYICISKVTKDGDSYYLEAFLIHCETGKIENPATSYVEGGIGSVNKGCQQMANEMVGRTGTTTQQIRETVTAEVTQEPKPEKKVDTNPNNFMIFEVEVNFKKHKFMICDKGFNEEMTYVNAKRQCAALSYGGYSDWRLPTLKESEVLMKNQNEMDNWVEGCPYYWTGTSKNETFQYVMRVNYGSPIQTMAKTSRYTAYARPVRDFK